MNKPLKPVVKRHKNTKWCNFGNSPANFQILGILCRNRNKRVILKLFQAQIKPPGRLILGNNYNINFVTNFEKFCRVFNFLP